MPLGCRGRDSLIQIGQAEEAFDPASPFSLGLSFCYHQTSGSGSTLGSVVEEDIHPTGEANEILWLEVAQPGGSYCPFPCAPSSQSTFTIGAETSTEVWADGFEVFAPSPDGDQLVDPLSVASRVDDAFDIAGEFPNQVLPDVDVNFSGQVCGFVCTQDWVIPCASNQRVAADTIIAVLRHHSASQGRSHWTEYQFSKERQ